MRAVRIDLAMRALVKAEKLEPTPKRRSTTSSSTTAKAMNVDAEILRTNLRDSGRVVGLQRRGRQDEGVAMAAAIT